MLVEPREVASVTDGDARSLCWPPLSLMPGPEGGRCHYFCLGGKGMQAASGGAGSGNFCCASLGNAHSLSEPGFTPHSKLTREICLGKDPERPEGRCGGRRGHSHCRGVHGNSLGGARCCRLGAQAPGGVQWEALSPVLAAGRWPLQPLLHTPMQQLPGLGAQLLFNDLSICLKGRVQREKNRIFHPLITPQVATTTSSRPG